MVNSSVKMAKLASLSEYVIKDISADIAGSKNLR